MGDANPAKLIEELHKAKQSLSEVIDECVFVERQRDQIEQELTAELRERDRLVSDTCASLVSLTEYLSLLERRVILPALGTFSAVVCKVPAVGGARSLTVESVEESLSANNSTYFRGILARMAPIANDIETGIRQMLLDTAKPFSIEESYVLLRALLEEKDKLVKKLNDTLLHVNSVGLKLRDSRSVSVNHGDEIRELRQKVVTLTQELKLCEDEKREVLHRLALLQEDLSRGRESVRELHQLRQTVAHQDRTIELLRLSSSGSPARLQPHFLASKSGNGGVGDVDEEGFIPQLKANEMAIGALNKELAMLEENYRVLDRRSERKQEELQSELAGARRRHQAEQEECNTVLGRVTMELEKLVDENAQLKKRLKQVHAKKRPVTEDL
ncbi:hypothetical protein TraAM80_07364 [Trypanosoma rangeli]|uniref:Uncharacterized protein n=1 Tax=Trypanosoma rangeli TaxID=5698 RepID=A0A3R7K310_TRYRA|nr:uncharacterized protein TraAM80_07364 [Trypanosoma rangeli]RNF00848.1 hypothetical protein TraAM80_07364 [Trypanosoma rangeli]|eukprot:RNF00848.1 hypothetical protein TraAM80_07364 [Trypanosoma rangeli]